IERSLRFAPRFCDAHLERIRVLLELRRADDLDGAMAELTERCNDPEIRARARTLKAEQAAAWDS
ncbi:MAG: hypothetical protein AAF657_20800, partial [Acidobacteriota bacterium]